MAFPELDIDLITWRIDFENNQRSNKLPISVAHFHIDGSGDVRLISSVCTTEPFPFQGVAILYASEYF